jgi:hypothetical protein
MAKRTKRPVVAESGGDILTSARGSEPPGEAPQDEKPQEDAPESEPLEAPAPEPVAPKEEPAPEGRFAARPKEGGVEAQPGDLALSARQFLRARKLRWERAAGFLAEMKRVGPQLHEVPQPKKHKKPIARLTVRQWQAEWDAFWKRPVGPAPQRRR